MHMNFDLGTTVFGNYPYIRLILILYREGVKEMKLVGDVKEHDLLWIMSFVH